MEYYTRTQLQDRAQAEGLEWIETGGGVDYIGRQDIGHGAIIGHPDTCDCLPLTGPVYVYIFHTQDWTESLMIRCHDLPDALRVLKSLYDSDKIKSEVQP